MRGLIRTTRRRRRLDLLVFAGLIVLLLAVIRLLPEPPALEVDGFARVIDGDSLAIGASEVRLQGIDAPELRQTCMREGALWACGEEAARRLRALIAGHPVRCASREEDKHGRRLGVCRVGDVELNQWMVLNGWAVSYHDYASAERKAKAARRGLWSGEFQTPKAWRDEHGL